MRVISNWLPVSEMTGPWPAVKAYYKAILRDSEAMGSEGNLEDYTIIDLVYLI